MSESPHYPPFCIDNLVDLYYQDVLRLCISLLNDADEAEDAAQEAFVAAYLYQESFRGECSLKTWLFAIAINACRVILRKRQRQKSLDAILKSIQKVFGLGSTVEHLTAERDQNQHLWATVEAMDEKHRLPILLHYVQGFSAVEIANMLEVQEGTVYSRLHYARKQLEKELGQGEWRLEVL